MPRYIALLRAINVGGHVVKMDRLRMLFEQAGCRNVETFIASGNVVFDSSSTNTRTLEEKIERHLEKGLGYDVVTFLRTPAELAAVAAYKPFTAEGHALWVAFLKTAPTDEARQRLADFRTENDDFHAHQREVYWLRQTKFSESKFSGVRFEKALGPSTMRNVTTVRKLAAKCEG
jgi:uncharacterized protein (DUF1697 family)